MVVLFIVDKNVFSRVDITGSGQEQLSSWLPFDTHRPENANITRMPITAALQQKRIWCENCELILTYNLYIYTVKLFCYFYTFIHNGLWAIWAGQHAPYTLFLPRPARKEYNIPKLLNPTIYYIVQWDDGMIGPSFHHLIVSLLFWYTVNVYRQIN